MNKFNYLNRNILSKTNVAIFSILLMVLGFLVSRFLLSMSMILLGVSSLRNIHPREWLKQKWWLLGSLWLGMYALSFFWSYDISDWSRRFEVKLPILLLPLAFAFIPSFSLRQLKLFTYITAILLMFSCGYSLWFLFSGGENVSEQYIYSKVLPTIAQNDHIRFSLFVALFIIWCTSLWSKYTKKEKIGFGIIMLLFAAFLHVLAARTGLLGFYIFLSVWAIYSIFNKSRLTGVVIILSICLSSIIAYKFIPTLRNKVNYVVYSYKMYQSGNHTGNYSDIGRLLSYDIAIKKVKENMLIGVGSGDVVTAMEDGYNKWHPYVEKEFRIIPHNQFLVVALATGLLGFLLFSIWVFIPILLLRQKGSIYFFASWLILMPLLLVEPALEVQRGVFVFLIFLLLHRHRLLKGIDTTLI